MSGDVRCPTCGRRVVLAIGAASGSVQPFAYVTSDEGPDGVKRPWLWPDSQARMRVTQTFAGGWVPHWRACPAPIIDADLERPHTGPPPTRSPYTGAPMRG